jgi:hypothetical protein
VNSLRKFLFFIFSALQLCAQSTGRISGTVVDSSNAVIPGASAVVTNTQTGLSRTIQTNQEGVSVFPDLPIGTYSIEFSKDGFQKQRNESVSLTALVPGVQSTVAPHAPLGLLFPGDTGIQDSVFKKNWKGFAPRAGFAWNMGAAGKTVVRGGFGLFYSLPEGLLYQRTDATQPTNLYLDIPAPQSFSNPYLNYPGGSPFPRGHVDGCPICRLSIPIASFGRRARSVISHGIHAKLESYDRTSFQRRYCGVGSVYRQPWREHYGLTAIESSALLSWGDCGQRKR